MPWDCFAYCYLNYEKLVSVNSRVRGLADGFAAENEKESKLKAEKEAACLASKLAENAE